MSSDFLRPALDVAAPAMPHLAISDAARPHDGRHFAEVPTHVAFDPPGPTAAEAQADAIAERVAAPEQAPGSTFPAGLSRRLERETGLDFSRIRVHADPAAAARVAQFGAVAMAEGRDLYFSAGRWRPDRPDGARLAAHEAEHAVQQGCAERPATL